jgi:2-oxoglutarate ferredoxin oxidoreductase subunit alpha
MQQSPCIKKQVNIRNKKEMGEIKLMKGNEALAEAAIRAGLQGYFGYPITPQSEVVEYLAREEPKHDYVLLQAESELAAVNMMYGAGGAGARVMTTTSSPGFSLMQEGISYIACAQIPCLFANIVRGGPGLGTIQPSQSDYFQATKGGGHGDYHLIVLAPNSVQKVQLPDPIEYKPDKPWATVGKKSGQERNFLTSLYIQPEEMEKKNIELQAKFKKIEENEVRFEEYRTNDAEIIIVSFGLSSRISKKSVDMAREAGLKVGLFRPITVWPFPANQIADISARKQVKFLISVEMNAGQMVEDVKLAVNGKKPVYFYGRMGGIIPTPKEIFTAVQERSRS